MVRDELISKAASILEAGREVFSRARHSSNLYSFIIGAGLMGFVSLGMRGCDSASPLARENLKPKVDLTQPMCFDVLNDKLYIRYHDGNDVAVSCKISPQGVKYFIGTDGGNALIPANVDRDGRILAYRK